MERSRHSPRYRSWEVVRPEGEYPGLRQQIAESLNHARDTDRNQRIQRRKLQSNLARFDLKEVDVPGDNNCQFHALVDQLKILKNHKTDAFALRNDCVDWLHANGDMFMELDHPNGDNSLLREAVVATTKYRYEHKYDDYDFDTYLRIMRQHDTEWGDDWTLLSFAAKFELKVRVVSSASDQVHSQI